MAKIGIHVWGKEPAWFQFDDSDGIDAYLSRCGYGRDDIAALVQWAVSPCLGAYNALPSARVHKERGNVETWDNRTGEWISSPPEMEAFLSEIRDVCKRHGLSLRADNNGDATPLLVQAYNEHDNMSMIDAAVKDYVFDEIRKQPDAVKMHQAWEYQSVYIDLYDWPGRTVQKPDATVQKVFPLGDLGNAPWWQKELEHYLNVYGDAGWEVVSIDSGLMNGKEACGHVLLKRLVEG